MPEEGGPLHQVTTVDLKQEQSHRLPTALPGGRAVLFTARPSLTETDRVESVVLATGERTVVVEDGTDARYLPTGHLVFMRRGVLMAAPFDVEGLEVRGSPVPVLESVSQAVLDVEEAGLFDVSDAGDLIYDLKFRDSNRLQSVIVSEGFYCDPQEGESCGGVENTEINTIGWIIGARLHSK